MLCAEASCNDQKIAICSCAQKTKIVFTELLRYSVVAVVQAKLR